ncbi:RNA polymerase sigma factor [Planctomycetes bacterium Poly30]|uniref:RNA polymerase sigma factor n=1 Tax=Saltatorellus ferox TaxID=2528018 RepID=A0A518ER62_9BACT|nr:RNA polymerase sigma factor [Planctomycetes bacterium Poly30]
MKSDETVTQWIQGIKGGDEHAAEMIWQRFFQRVCGLANQRLGSTPRAASDSEDVALSAIHALYRGARDDRFRQLQSREDLWNLLAVITIRKSIDARRRSHAREGVSGSSGSDVDDVADPLSLFGGANTCSLDALCATGHEMVESLEEKLRPVAMLRLEGYSNQEIASKLGRSLPTIERYLRMIRHQWQE